MSRLIRIVASVAIVSLNTLGGRGHSRRQRYEIVWTQLAFSTCLPATFLSHLGSPTRIHPLDVANVTKDAIGNP